LNRDGAKFCHSCGFKLGSAKETGTQPLGLLNNRYEIINEVKSGAMGCVYKARDTALDIIVAVKKLFSQTGAIESEEASGHFLREAQLLSQLHHSGLPKVTDYFSAVDPINGGTSHFLVMTYIDGEDLESYIKRRGLPLPVKDVKSITLKVLDILRYLHSRKPPIIYRDIKPSNIMISGDNVYLVDFGIARVFSHHQRGTMIGTPGYAPPEQYKGFTDERSDLYSLGVLMHYLLTGTDPEDSMVKPFSFEPVNTVNSQVPKEIEMLVASMVEILPDDRPANVNEIIDELEDVEINVPPPPLVKPNTITVNTIRGPFTNSTAKKFQFWMAAIFCTFFMLAYISNIKGSSKTPPYQPQDLSEYYNNEGGSFLAARSFEKAIASFTKSINDNDRDPKTYVQRGYAYLMSGNKTRAMTDFNRAISLNPKYAEAYYYKGFISQDTDPGLALDALNTAIKLKQDYIPAYMVRGDVFVKLGIYDEADKDYFTAYKNDKDKSLIHYKFANTAFLRKDWQRAMRQIDFAISYLTKSSPYYLLRGKIFYETGKITPALLDFKQSISLDSQNGEAYYMAAMCWEKTGNFKWAGEHLRQALKVNISNELRAKILKSLENENYRYDDETKLTGLAGDYYKNISSGSPSKLKTLLVSPNLVRDSYFSAANPSGIEKAAMLAYLIKGRKASVVFKDLDIKITTLDGAKAVLTVTGNASMNMSGNAELNRDKVNDNLYFQEKDGKWLIERVENMPGK
jgi:serine/threonine protein kinase